MVSFGGKTKSPCFDLFIPWLIKQITNTYLNHFSRSYENRSNMLSNVRIFIVLRSEEGLTSTNKDKSANFSGEKNRTIKNTGVCSEWVKNFKSNLDSYSFLSSNRKNSHRAIKHLFKAVQSAAEKTVDISRLHLWFLFPAKWPQRNERKSFILLTCHFPIWVLLLIGWSNSRANQWWRREMSAFFSGYPTNLALSVKIIF